MITVPGGVVASAADTTGTIVRTLRERSGQLYVPEPSSNPLRLLAESRYYSLLKADTALSDQGKAIQPEFPFKPSDFTSAYRPNGLPRQGFVSVLVHGAASRTRMGRFSVSRHAISRNAVLSIDCADTSASPLFHRNPTSQDFISGFLPKVQKKADWMVERSEFNCRYRFLDCHTNSLSGSSAKRATGKPALLLIPLPHSARQSAPLALRGRCNRPTQRTCARPDE